MARETDVKTERLARLAHAAGMGGVLITTQRNFAWLTGGATNRLDSSREPGAGALFVGADGRRAVIANAIEMPRLANEALVGLGFESVEYAWIDDHAKLALLADLARSLTSGAAPIAADWPLAETANLEPAIMRLRAPLVDEEIDRYRALGRDMGAAVGSVCRTLHPGQTEEQVAASVRAAITLAAAQPIVVLVGADDRIARYRHPVATAAAWQRAVLVVVCAERHGLVVALSRYVVAGAPSDILSARMQGTAQVFARLLQGTVPGATGADLYRIAARAYEDAGYAGEETRHHQGGATGYRSREWLAHPQSPEIVMTRQAFAWNPSITGAKIEDTVLVVDGRQELLTASPGWPQLPLAMDGGALHAAAPLLI